MTISDILVAEIAGYAIVFCRLGAALMFMPGIGDSTVNVRARLLFALAMALAMGGYADPAPVLQGFWPAVVAILQEVTIGLYLGVAARLAVAALQTAGTIIAAQISLANAISFDAISAQQGALPASFLSMIGVVLIFATGLHHVMLSGVAHSYETFPVGAPIPIDDIAQVATILVADGFAIALALSAPFILVGVTVSMGMGLLARLMPQVQVFFIVMPLQIAVGLALMALTLGAGMTWFLGRFVEMQSLTVFGG